MRAGGDEYPEALIGCSSRNRYSSCSREPVSLAITAATTRSQRGPANSNVPPERSPYTRIDVVAKQRARAVHATPPQPCELLLNLSEAGIAPVLCHDDRKQGLGPSAQGLLDRMA